MTTENPAPNDWRVEPFGVPADRRYILMRRTASGDLEYMADQTGNMREFPSAAAAQAAAVIAKVAEKR